MRSRVLPRVAAVTALLAAPLAGCGFSTYNGRWVANVPPAGGCCPSRVVMDVDGHEVQGSVEDCNGVTSMEGRVNDQGQATLHMHGQTSQATFNGINFTGPVPNDRCGRTATGNLGG
jgi:hypothetical protein